MSTPLKDLEEKAREIAAQLGAVVPPGTGFALLLFDFGEGGNLTWISNAEREDMLQAMRELVAKWTPPASDGRKLQVVRPKSQEPKP